MKKVAALWIERGLVVRYAGHDYVVERVNPDPLTFDLRPAWAHIAEQYRLGPVAAVSYRKVEKKPAPAGLTELLRLR